MKNTPFSHLYEIAVDLENQAISSARLKSKELRSQLSQDKLLTPLTLQGLIFLNALSLRLNDAPEMNDSNLYLKKFEVPQIELFNLLAQDVPLVSASTQIVNSLIISTLQNNPNAVLLDIGIGTGRQEAALIESLAESNCLPKEFTIIGIEPSADSLALARQTFHQLEEKLKIKIQFKEICGFIDQLSDDQWRFLDEYRGRLIVNESFAIHHIPFKISSITNLELRDEILSQIKKLEPIRFLLCEPNSDHNRPNLAHRLKNTWNHFGLIFSVIDELQLSELQKNALKVSFFGREIEDILGTPESHRSERHETGEIWQQRLERAGFKSNQKWDSILTNLAASKSKFSLISLSVRNNYLSLDYNGNSIISILSVE